MYICLFPGVHCEDPDTGLRYPANSTWPATKFNGSYTCFATFVPVDGEFKQVTTILQNKDTETPIEEQIEDLAVEASSQINEKQPLTNEGMPEMKKMYDLSKKLYEHIQEMNMKLQEIDNKITYAENYENTDNDEFLKYFECNKNHCPHTQLRHEDLDSSSTNEYFTYSEPTQLKDNEFNVLQSKYNDFWNTAYVIAASKAAEQSNDQLTQATVSKENYYDHEQHNHNEYYANYYNWYLNNHNFQHIHANETENQNSTYYYYDPATKQYTQNVPENFKEYVKYYNDYINKHNMTIPVANQATNESPASVQNNEVTKTDMKKNIRKSVPPTFTYKLESDGESDGEWFDNRNSNERTKSEYNKSKFDRINAKLGQFGLPPAKPLKLSKLNPQTSKSRVGSLNTLVKRSTGEEGVARPIRQKRHAILKKMASAAM